MKIRDVQQVLKSKGVTLNQNDIRKILKSLSISVTEINDENCDEIFSKISASINQIEISTNRKSNSSLKKLEDIEPEEINVAEEKTNFSQQSARTQTMLNRMNDAAEDIAASNVDMAKVFPQLVEAKTFQQLNEAEPEIQESWNNTVETISSVLFGL